MQGSLRAVLWMGLSILLLFSACTVKEKGASTATQAQLVSTLGQLETQLRLAPEQDLDTTKVTTFVDYAEALAERFPQDSLAPLYLFRAAELSYATGQLHAAIDLWGKINSSFNKYNRSPEAAFMQGFVAENDLKDKEKAINFYQAFLTQYPEHPMAKDARVLVDNLKKGISDRELIEQFEQQQ